MVAAVKWEAASTKTTIINLGTTLADNTMSAVGAEYDNSSNLNTKAWFELTTSDASALFDTTSPDDVVPEAILYVTQAPDGSNYENAPLTGGADQEAKRVIAFPIEKNTSHSRIVVGPIDLPPHKLKFYLDGQWGSATLTAEWEVNLYSNNYELQ